MAAVLQELKPLAELGMISPRSRARMIRSLRQQGIQDQQVLAAMERVPRHLFVAEALASRAYEPVSLPIGWGQTISQPMMVARMLASLMAANRPRRVLEIGTGSGYQTALLAALGLEVCSIERIEGLARAAQARLFALGFQRVQLRLGDGGQGWQEQAPFDAIIFTAAVPCALPPLFHQLRAGGTLLMPQELQGGQQRLKLFRWDGIEAMETDLGDCLFVPLRPGTVIQRDRQGA
ncbi:MAG: protein-L-isoaspartate(D-aspartate) O-methyltransferase [Acidithiobacillus sp.]|nr:protein-L-isoaspartate(D-aspartate) O-methyltransferase [Acidithiobacillus sp.]